MQSKLPQNRFAGTRAPIPPVQPVPQPKVAAKVELPAPQDQEESQYQQDMENSGFDETFGEDSQEQFEETQESQEEELESQRQEPQVRVEPKVLPHDQPRIGLNSHVVMGKRSNALPLSKETKKNTKVGAGGQCKSCNVNITTSNKAQLCKDLSGNSDCDASFCISCLVGKSFCNKCKCHLTFLPKNNKIKSHEFMTLHKTHSFSDHILKVLPASFHKQASMYTRKEKRICELTLEILRNKETGDFVSELVNSEIIEIQNAKKEYKKQFDGLITQMKVEKMNVKCLSCPGSLTKTKDDAVSCSTCKLKHCNRCFSIDRHEGPCNYRISECAECSMVTSQTCNMFCLGCFTFYSGDQDLSGLSAYSVDINSFPVIKNINGLDGLRKEFANKYELNKATLFTYITKYNHSIQLKNQKLFWSFIENVLCGTEVTSDHDKRIVEYAMIQADRNMLNKIEQLEKFLVTGMNMDEDTLAKKVMTINKLFHSAIDNKPLITADMAIKPLPAKTKTKVAADAEDA
jgi:hypothetical protein